MIYAVMKDGQCIDKIVWDGVTPYKYTKPHDELVEDPENKIPVLESEIEIINESVEESNTSSEGQ